jgi:RecB family exonuclease/inactivated superfamily I helicase
VITPRRTRLIRVPDLHVFRNVIVDVASGFSRTAVIVPTRGARVELQSWLSRCGVGADDAAIVTRDELYEVLHGRLRDAPRRLTAFERDAMAQAAAAEAAGEYPDLPFQIRPGLVAEILRFYDHLRRQAQHAKRFEELIVDAIGDGESDSGARRMLQQTRFLAAVFAGYERRVRESGAADEHLLRERVIAEPLTRPLEQVVVTVPDWIADPAGLFVADFDMLARMPDVAALDLVATEGVLGSGFHERVHSWWPGLEEIEGTAIAGTRPRLRPMLVVPDAGNPQQMWFVHRDREEELIAVADRLKDATPETLDRVAVVFKAPLPYLYLARDAFGEAKISYRTTESLPLATEPTVAALDLVLDAVETRFARVPLVALLRSPHFVFEPQNSQSPQNSFTNSAGSAVDDAGTADFAALDRTLSAKRYLGGLARLETLATEEGTAGVAAAVQAALAAARALVPLIDPSPASQHLSRLRAFLTEHFKPSATADGDRARGGADVCDGAREQQARDAVLGILTGLITAHRSHHDPEWGIEELAAGVRRWVGEETFAAPANGGLHLIDDQAARYNEFEDVSIVGLVENEWPERPRRNIFYPPALLKALGWPSEKDRRAASDARFLDLIASATSRVALSTFTLEDEALVTRSLQLDEVHRAMLSTLSTAEVVSAAASQDLQSAGAWSELRAHRLPPEDPRFHGSIGPFDGRAWSVSALETYLSCPFKFYAQHVLRLEEEPEDEEVMDPRRQGEFVHGVFETFFREWSEAGHGAITAANLEGARAVFRTVVEAALLRLNEGEAGLERTRLLGSPAAAGLGEAVFRMEAERDVPVVERLLEHRLTGDLRIATAEGERVVTIRGKVDRIDLLADGTFRLIDYKLGWPPDRGRALQLPIYGLWAQQNFAGRHGRTWTLGEAAYLAFKGPRRVVPLFSKPDQRDEVLASAQQRLADAIDAIAGGSFPPSPTDVFLCESCSFAAVCRKDYVGDV